MQPIYLLIVGLILTFSQSAIQTINLKRYQFKAFSSFNARQRIIVPEEYQSRLVLQYQVDSVLIMAKDTGMYSLYIMDTEKIDTLMLKVEQNADFKKEWEKVSFDSIVPLMVNDNLTVLNNFQTYQLYHQSLPPSFFEATQLDSNQLKGKVSLINTWFWGCKPCMKEIPALNQLKDSFADNDNINFYSLFYNDTTMVGDSIFFASRSVTSSQFNYVYFNWSHFPNSKEYDSQFFTHGKPIMYLIDQDLKIRYIKKGASVEVEKNMEYNAVYSYLISTLLAEFHEY